MSGYRPGALLHVAPAVVYVLAVFYVGSIAPDPLGDVPFLWKDKLLHALAFGGMQITLARAFRFSYPERSTGAIALQSTIAATLLGGLLELWQAALPHRSAEWWDFVADGVGAAIAGLLWWRFHREVPKAS